MMWTALRLVIVGMVVSLSGCSNAIYYYQSDRVSLTLETRPDPTQPVQGNLGIKQRIAVITPGLESTPTEEASQPPSVSPPPAGSGGSSGSSPSVAREARKGEALSMIGSFKFGKEKGSAGDTGPVVIKAALICGDAATGLKPDEVKAATAALVGIPTYDSLAKRSIQIAETKGEIETLRKLTLKNFKQLTNEEKNKLGEITNALSNYDEELHEAIRKALTQRR